MPGIAGIISRSKSPDECQRLAAVMTQSMMNESFYVSGTQAFGDLGIFAGWVAHDASFAADQPFWNERRDIALLFAGECFPEGRARAANSSSLIQRYEELGEKFLESLNGLFSGLLVDLRLKRAFLFNDRYGIERLYWHEAKDATYFASEAKALLRVLPEVRAFDAAGVAEYLSYGCTLDWKTLFRGVQLAPGGTQWTIEKGEAKRGRYFTPAQWENLPKLTEAEFDAQFAETFVRILPAYVQRNAPVGISLTGGLDTRMIMAALPREGTRAATYTFAAATGETLDARIARRVAEACGLKHELLRLGDDFFARFGALTDRTVLQTDGCFGALGAHEIYLHQQARQRSTVRLTGNFGSEVLRSMSTFKAAPIAPGLLSDKLTATVERAGGARNPVTFAAFQEVPWNLFGCLAAGRSQLTFRTPYLDNEIVKLAFQAPASARTSPEPAVRFVKQASPALGAIATDRAQAGSAGALGRAARRAWSEITFKLDYMCSEGLPFGLSAFDTPYRACCSALGISGSHKFLQYRRWLQGELAGFVRERIAGAGLPYWNRPFLETMAREHIAGRRNFTREINLVATLEAVDRLMLRQS